MNYPLEPRIEWRKLVVPNNSRKQPIHRWYVFPHSFSRELVHSLIEEWKLDTSDRILDPFVGAGTSLLAAKEKGVSATGYDLSPLAVFATKVKVTNYDVARLERLWLVLQSLLRRTRCTPPSRKFPDLVKKALPGKLLPAFHAIDRRISNLDASGEEQDFFRLALFSLIPEYSHAIPTGGWLSWVQRQQVDVARLFDTYNFRVSAMVDDLRYARQSEESVWSVHKADARSLPDPDSSYSAAITSPPYPNRHDYSRVFGVELMFGFLDWEQTRELRYQSFHSHPEARPTRPVADNYTRPKKLHLALQQIREKGAESRIADMLDGYFLDVFLGLHEICRVCKHKAKVAIVVGNVQYGGLPIPVDELTAEVGEMSGLTCEKLLVVRMRGNSAQQMAKYGKRPSRESIVLFNVS